MLRWCLFVCRTDWVIAIRSVANKLKETDAEQCSASDVDMGTIADDDMLTKLSMQGTSMGKSGGKRKVVRTFKQPTQLSCHFSTDVNGTGTIWQVYISVQFPNVWSNSSHDGYQELLRISFTLSFTTFLEPLVLCQTFFGSSQTFLGNLSNLVMPAKWELCNFKQNTKNMSSLNNVMYKYLSDKLFIDCWNELYYYNLLSTRRLVLRCYSVTFFYMCTFYNNKIWPRSSDLSSE